LREIGKVSAWDAVKKYTHVVAAKVMIYNPAFGVKEATLAAKVLKEIALDEDGFQRILQNESTEMGRKIAIREKLLEQKDLKGKKDLAETIAQVISPNEIEISIPKIR